MRSVILPLFTALFCTTVQAAAPKGCYERVYDAAYLTQNNVQQVDSIQVQLGQMPANGTPDTEEDQDIMAVTFRGIPSLFYSGLSCSNDICETDDNGRLRIEPTAKGIKVTILKAFNIPQEGGGPLSGKLEPDADSGVFALRKVSSKHCSYFFDRRKGT